MIKNSQTEIQSRESKGVEYRGERYGNKNPVRNPKFRGVGSTINNLKTEGI